MPNMDSASALAGHLLLVTGDPVDSQQVTLGLTRLAAQLAATVPSLAAVTLVVLRYGLPIPVSILAGDGAPTPILASLAVPLSAAPSPDLLIAHARTAGAFLLLADDLKPHLPGPAGAPLQLDQHLHYPPLVGHPLPLALSDLQAIDQSIGVLLDQGLTPTAALTELTRRTPATLPATAQTVLQSTQPPNRPATRRP
jgi:hypothetical protein